MKKNKFKKILVVFSLCVFLLSLFSVSSFALNISDVHRGHLYKFSGSLTFGDAPSGSTYDVYIDYSQNTVSQSSVETIFSRYWSYTVTTINSVKPMFDKASIALNGGTNGDGVAYDGLLGMVAKFGKFLVSTPLLLVLCIALPLVSFSVGLIIRIKNRA